ncbi:MAG: hypothetical protein RSE15_00670 [Flavobacterium sp.]|uniref:hypothetical protein n=1 Tax=Flavobacterium sp. TaxID=239 RepID=UPI002B475A9F|nr:hypothetical protein [Flavobacterium sp.]WRH73360.1 MAG: hypothetical protein RSE15_00670 [Flavobacterium sp.]
MKPEEIHFKWCTENGIRIYPVPVSASNTGNYHIVVERNGKASKGNLIFNEKPIAKVTEEVVRNKIVKRTIVTPSVSQQIRTLYKMIYEKESVNQDRSARAVNAE